ncbi:hypothetical protein KR018_008737 [Drosophila ironensis]|nr:hypothetical protein KR018_008737 [Drosophila ironensis]
MHLKKLKTFGATFTLTFLLVFCLLTSRVDARRRRVEVKIGRETNHTKILSNLMSQTNLQVAKTTQLTTTAVKSSDSTTPFSSEQLTNSYNTEFYGSITLGCQDFKILIDTASANLWVPSSNCTEEVCLQHNRYNSSSCKSYVANGTDFSIQYATRVDQEVILEGFLSTDTLQMAGLTVKNQTFAEITSLPEAVFNRSQFDGILGFGLKELAIGGVVPPFYNMIAQGLVEEPIIGLYLNRNASDPSNGGKVLLGGSDPTLYSGCLTYVPLSVVEYWQITVGSFSFGCDKAICSEFEAIIDAGTSLIVVPESALEKINSKLGIKDTDKRDGVYIIDCKKVSGLPNVTINIGRKNFTLSANDYVLNYSGTCVSGFSTLADGSAGIPIGNSDSKCSPWVLGDIFLSTFYVELDFQYKQIAFGARTTNYSTSKCS